ncbi:uncharacterized protein LOC110860932 isoform X2 [Folsomia candida]|uniref:uncharacterized protein LOC110860932 isoform X2 n=1 Tax=Folsomia candida TaxID=158441 RepID=UPI00160516C3|nr:uncharacterized protein LOC110860932 isoform X2 [Folsomia candida]
MPTSKLKKFRKQSVLRMNEVNEARRRQKKGNTLMLNNTTDSCLLCHTAGTNPTTPTPNLDLNARVIFLLQKLLHVSPTVCDDLLQNYGHPADWISLCFKCNDIVVKGCKLFDQITKLEEELDSIREQVKSKVSVKEEIGEDGDREESDSATKIIRRYLVSSGFVGEESDIGVEIYPDPDVSIKVEVDESDGAIPPPDFVTHYFNLDKNEPFVLPSVEAVGVDPLAFQDDEMVEYIPSANQPPRRGRPRKQARVTQTKKGRMIGKISKPATVQDYDRDEDEKSDQDDRHNDYSDQGSLAPSAQPEPATLSWAEIMAKFPPPPPTPEDEELIPSQRHEKELERLTNLATKYNITSFPCPHCPKEMSKISYWSSHVDWCTDKTMGYKCDTCEKVVKTKEVLENHILSTHVSEEAFTCCGCNTFFRRWEYFDDHAIKNADCAKFAIFCTNAPCKIAFSSEQNPGVENGFQLGTCLNGILKCIIRRGIAPSATNVGRNSRLKDLLGIMSTMFTAPEKRARPDFRAIFVAGKW